jgi:hypothetical protein
MLNERNEGRTGGGAAAVLSGGGAAAVVFAGGGEAAPAVAPVYNTTLHQIPSK